MPVSFQNTAEDHNGRSPKQRFAAVRLAIGLTMVQLTHMATGTSIVISTRVNGAHSGKYVHAHLQESPPYSLPLHAHPEVRLQRFLAAHRHIGLRRNRICDVLLLLLFLHAYPDGQIHVLCLENCQKDLSLP